VSVGRKLQLCRAGDIESSEHAWRFRRMGSTLVGRAPGVHPRPATPRNVGRAQRGTPVHGMYRRA
jgi:hypothetical protein